MKKRITAMIVLVICLVAGGRKVFAWNPGWEEWRTAFPTEIYQQYRKKASGHPFFTKTAIEYLRRMKGDKYFYSHLNDYGGAIIFGSSYADHYSPDRTNGDAVNHYYRFHGDHAFGCPPEWIPTHLIGYLCSYAHAAEYADYLYDIGVKHWLGIRNITREIPKDDKFANVGKDSSETALAMDRDFILGSNAKDDTKEKAAIYLGWAAHLIQDMAQPYHTTNNLGSTRNYHQPFEDAMDEIIRNGKLRVPMDTWTGLGGIDQGTASRLGIPAPASGFITGLRNRKLRPSAMAIDNGQNSRYFVTYLKETACDDGGINLTHDWRPCRNFYEEKWGQIMQVQADRAIKTTAELIAMFMEEVRSPSIVSAELEDAPSKASADAKDLPLAPAYGGASRRTIEVKVDRNPHTKSLILDAKWAGRWHEGVAISTTDTLTLDASKPSIPEGVIELRVRACYAQDICTGISASRFVVVDRTPPIVKLTELSANSFSDSLPVQALASDNRNWGIATTTISALYQGSGESKPSWKVLATRADHSAFVNQSVASWPEQMVRLRGEACDKAGNCVQSPTQTIRVDHSSTDLVVLSIRAAASITKPANNDQKQRPIFRAQRKTKNGEKPLPTVGPLAQNQRHGHWGIMASVHNTGGKAAGRFKIILKQGSNIVSTALENVGLKAGESKTYQLFTTVDPNSCESSFSVIADSENSVRESNESNNARVGGRVC